MRITKIDGFYHSKIEKNGESIGSLKQLMKNDTNQDINMIVKERVRERFATQIESRIHKEFFRLKGNKKNNKNNFCELFSLLKKLYLNILNPKESIRINIDLEKLKNLNMEELKKDDEILKRYKLNENNYLVKLENGKTSKSFLKMFLELQKEINMGKIKQLSDLTSYKELQKVFDIYVNRKIDYLVKSLINNKIYTKALESQNNEFEPSENAQTKFYMKLIEKCKENPKEDILTQEIKKYSESIVSTIQEIVEIIENKEKKIPQKRKEILGKIREKCKEKIEQEELGEKLLKIELKLFVTRVISSFKQKIKKKNGNSEENELYLKYLIKELGDKEKLKVTIEENFKNRFVSKVLEYGKYLHYLKGKVVTSKELEFIKAKESLNSKFSTIMSFAIHTFNKFLIDGTPYDFLDEKVGVKFDIKYTEKIDFAKIKYFFSGIENYNDEEKKFFVKALHKSLYNYRLQIAHFNKENSIQKIDLKKDTKGEEKFNQEDTKVTYNYLSSNENKIIENLKKKFNSNNLEYYYDEKEIKKYFNLYQYELLKNKVPYAPNFKRIIEKGQKLYQHTKKRYKYFFIFKNEKRYDKYTIEEKKAYLNTKNYLLKELYYNNFFRDFLDNKGNSYFLEAINNAKNRKNNSKGMAYKQFANYEEGNSISEYIANIHRLEMNKLQEERYSKSEVKEKSKYINEYLEDIFLEGFINWLEAKELGFLANKEKIERKENRKIDYKIKPKNNIDKNDYRVLMIFLILSLVDNKRISEFANELVKYKQYLEKRTEEESNFLKTDIDRWRELCELVLLTREQLSVKECEKIRREKGENNHLVNKYYGNNDKYFEIIKKFVEDDVFEESENIENENNMLYHSTDKKTPVLYGNLEKTRKFGLNSLIDNINYAKYSKSERDKYKKEAQEIEKLQKEKEELHLKWEKLKKNKDNNNEEYKKRCERIRKYDYLRKKQTMYVPFILHEIASDIQARFLGYIVKQERDFSFFKLVFDLSKEKDIDKIYENKTLANTFRREAYDKIRNYIAHFHHYIDEGGKMTQSFIDQMNMIIKFLAYDRKAKNQVNKSIKTVLEKYNIEIKFERTDNEDGSYSYIIKSINSKKGKSLGKKNRFEILEKDFVNEVRKLLEYKK